MIALVTDPFISMLGLIGAVIIVSALLSGLIERSGLPQVGVLLALGAVLGPFGLALIDPHLDSPFLRVVSTLSLALVLFTDALALDLAEIRRHAKLTLLVVGPGTLLSAALVGFAAWWLLRLPPTGAAILGAALASTDPVLLRGLLRWPHLPAEARQTLRLESGLNDIVLLPIVLVAMALAGQAAATEPVQWSRMMLQLFLLGPGAGVAIGLMGVATLDLVRRRLGIRRDYESLYSLGIAFAAYAAAESFHGSGFLAAFAAGLTISIFDVELCDCFQEYGETTAELALLFTFVLFGASLIWQGFTVINGTTLLFVLIALLARPLAFLLSLAPTRLDRRSLKLIVWFGPRGLSSLLIVLLPVFAHMPGSEELFPLCALVVLFSVVLHGGSLMFLGRSTPPPARAEGSPVLPVLPSAELPPAPAEETARASGLPSDETVPERITLAETARLQEAGEKVVLVDVRTARSIEGSDTTARGAVRIDPEFPAGPQAGRLGVPKEAWLIAFCA